MERTEGNVSIRLKLKWALTILIVAILAIIGYYSYSLYSFANRIHTAPGESRLSPSNGGDNAQSDAYHPPKWEGKERVNILLLGGDSRGLGKNEAPRADTLIVASIDPVTKEGALLSILRDTYVKIPGYGEERINASLALGGPELAMKTVSELLDLPIQYYIYTDFQGFIALIDAIGGIDFYVEKDMKYSDSADGHQYDIDLKEGMQRLDGSKALQYVRFRHDALSDYARTERQRNFLMALAEKMQSSSSLIKLPRILSAVDPYIETNLTVTDMLKLGSLAFEAKTNTLQSIQIPPRELLQEKTIRGASVIAVNSDKLHNYLKDKLEKSGESESGTDLQDEQNGSHHVTAGNR